MNVTNKLGSSSYGIRCIVPFSSLTVAYWLLARGQDDLLQIPVKLYSFRQNFWVFVLKKISRYSISTSTGQNNCGHKIYVLSTPDKKKFYCMK